METSFKGKLHNLQVLTMLGRPQWITSLVKTPATSSIMMHALSRASQTTPSSPPPSQWLCAPPPTTATHTATSAATGATSYRWDVGSSTSDQCRGIARWRNYTDSETFRDGMMQIVQDNALSNEEKSTAMEKYLLEAGEAAGVIRKCQIRAPLNPNKWGKHLAPWFNDSCR